MPQIELDLNRLRSDMIDYIRQTGIPVFYASEAADEDSYTFWNGKAFPDWRQFVDVGKECGARMLVFSFETLTEDELDSAVDRLGDADMDAEERNNYMRQFEGLRRHTGQTTWVRIAYEHGGRWWAYELSAPWYDEFQEALEDIEMYLPLAEDEDEDSSRGFFSRN